ncbi:hypothetical protein GCM10010124_04060 [Pilimelia terevasa]|uniref:Septum formation initiator family protein n=1 Tax=Pilimelia terevasa TaxID=53372 RepID=A0A8J3BJC2_9ACTN|nr:septum formation initiator family protein [Pilimelia terevasa]GGK14676.1 hypothetical protein GCM10010124_04060 [Pilimelia terevasa]
MQRRQPSGPAAARRSSPGRGGAARAGRHGARGAARERDARPEARRASTARPAGPRRATAARPGTTRTTAGRPRRLTGRAGVLLVLLLALALGYTYPVRQLLNQKAEIARLEAANAAKRENISALRERDLLWSDDAYVVNQARRRFYMVLPGERAYVVFDRGEVPTPGPGRRPAPPSWSDKLWSSVTAADAAPHP